MLVSTPDKKVEIIWIHKVKVSIHFMFIIQQKHMKRMAEPECVENRKKLSFFIGVVVSQIKMFVFVTREKCSIYIWHIPFHKYCNMDVTHEIHFTYVKVCTHLSDIKKKTNIWIWIRTNAMRISFCFSFFAEIQWIWA